MIRKRSLAYLRSVPDDYVYPVVLVCLLVGSAVALAMGQMLVGIAGVLALSIISLAYGALQTPEDMA